MCGVRRIAAALIIVAGGLFLALRLGGGFESRSVELQTLRYKKLQRRTSNRPGALQAPRKSAIITGYELAP